ncbi:hypothetical protein RRG08_033900 [Elysia crispata]|uniref:Lipocalin/cytosolic fatty-acid binding domain-containing protein n=1 Tax=Elysia crispata TaxID=231223 RepID=A0AAE1BA23_9GAST|nr:hypothetical protein RRG08_033900 [Elysia crispata]
MFTATLFRVKEKHSRSAWSFTLVFLDPTCLSCDPSAMSTAGSSLWLLAVCVASSSAFIVIRPGTCPRVATKQNFELNKYLGLWFSYENFDVPFQFGSSCVTALYSPASQPGAIRVVNSGVQRIKIGNEYKITGRDRAVGQAVVVDPKVPGGLKVSFGGSMPDFLDSDEANYQIMDTDYSNFSMVYSCSDFSPLPIKIESAWVLTRVPGKRPANLDDIYENLRSYNIDPSYFRRINQDKCWKPRGDNQRK